MAEFPALPLFTDAYLADTRHLTTLQHGAYLLMLMTAWRSTGCHLLDDDGYLARITGLDKRTWLANKTVLLSFWHLDDEQKWCQARLKDERNYVVSLRNKNAAAGRASALKRLSRSSTTVQPVVNENPTPTPTPIKVEKNNLTVIPKEAVKRGTRLPDDFEPDESCKTVARELSYTKARWDACLTEFKDYWIAVPGAKGVKIDWQATFRNRLRNYTGGGKINGTAQKPTIAGSLKIVSDAIDAEAARLGRAAEEDGGAPVRDEDGHGNFVALPRLREGHA